MNEEKHYYRYDRCNCCSNYWFDFFFNKEAVCENKQEIKEVETETMEKFISDTPSSSDDVDGYKGYFADAEFITVSKVVRTIEERPDGEIFTTYEEYLVGDVEFSTGSDFTEDYSKAMKGREFNAAAVEKGTFEEIFGFSYEDKNGWEIYEELLKSNYISGDFTKVTFDAETYEITTQELYEFEADESLWEYMLNGLVYDEIIEKQVTFQMMETENGVSYPDCFVAKVVYRDSDWVVTKSMFLQVIVNR